MVRRRPFLAWLLALLLSLQWGLAASHCLARLSAAAARSGDTSHHAMHHAGAEHHHHTEPAEGEEEPGPAGMAHQTCPVAPAPAMPVPPSPAAAPAQRIAYPVVLVALASPVVLPPARAPPGQPRAPPAA